VYTARASKVWLMNNGKIFLGAWDGFACMQWGKNACFCVTNLPKKRKGFLTKEGTLVH
jgi:hypothetical protein